MNIPSKFQISLPYRRHRGNAICSNQRERIPLWINVGLVERYSMSEVSEGTSRMVSRSVLSQSAFAEVR